VCLEQLWAKLPQTLRRQVLHALGRMIAGRLLVLRLPEETKDENGCAQP
jgi:hypothetical protein